MQQTLFRARFAPARCQIVVVEGRDIGVFSVQHQPDTLFLANLQLLPDVQKQGLLTAIIKTPLWQARQQGVPASLQVLKVNPARHLYERLGFTVIGETDAHYVMRITSETISPRRTFPGKDLFMTRWVMNSIVSVYSYHVHTIFLPSVVL